MVIKRGGKMMNYAISGLQRRMNATIDIYREEVSRQYIEEEIRAYVYAINELELYLYGEERTKLELVLLDYS